MKIKCKYVFLTSTMFSRNNGPANFAMNLFYNNSENIFFLTEDSEDHKNIIKVKVPLSKLLRPISMIIKAIEYHYALRQLDYEIAIWNFSVISWFSQVLNFSGKKNIVFVNDSLSLDSTWKINYSSIRLQLFRIFEKMACKRAHFVITNSKIIAEKIVDQYNIDPKYVKVLHKGIDVVQFDKVKTRYTIDLKQPIKIAFVKTNYKVGGLILLCDALEKLNEYNFDIHLFGPSTITANFHEYPNIKVKVMGKITKSELINRLNLSDLYCTPCTIEAYGQANIEALALQIPTVILPTIYQLALHDSEYCWIPKDCSSKELSIELKNLILSSDDIRMKKSLLGRKKVVNNYGLDNCLQQFKNLIDI